MNGYLLDENLSQVISEQVAKKNTSILIVSVHSWRGGAFKGMPDSRIIRAAAEEGLTLISYDRQTIPNLLKQIFSERESHSGILFVDNLSIKNQDIGGLVNAILSHWDENRDEDWNNRTGYLKPRTP